MIQGTDNLEATSYTHQCGDILLKLSNLKEKNSISSESESLSNLEKSSSKLTAKALAKLNNDNKLINKSSNNLSKKSNDRSKNKSKNKTKDKSKDSLINKKDLKTPIHSNSNRKRSDIENISDLKILKRVKSEMDTLYRPLVFYGPSGSGKFFIFELFLVKVCKSFVKNHDFAYFFFQKSKQVKVLCLKSCYLIFRTILVSPFPVCISFDFYIPFSSMINYTLFTIFQLT